MKRRISVMILIVLFVFVGAVQPAFALDKWGGVTDMLNLALAAGSFLVYSIVWQVNNSVDGIVGDAHAVYEAVKEDITPKITTWWNGLSFEDQQAFTEKVQTDEDLMVSEVIPQDIITDIVSQSVGYTNNVYSDLAVDSYNYDGISMSVDAFNNIGVNYDERYYSMGSHIVFSNGDSYDIPVGWVKWHLKEGDTSSCYVWNIDTGSFGDEIFGYLYYQTSWYPVVSGGLNSKMSLYTFKQNAMLTEAHSAFVNYNPDDQQLDPFYYPVDALNMADVWDVGTTSDSDLQSDQVIYDVVESGTWNSSVGVAESAIAVGLQGDVLIDNDTGLPFALGAVKPWEVNATDSASTTTTTDTTIDWEQDISQEQINWEPITGLGEMLLNKFPFCLPYDMYTLVQSMVVDPVPPHWEYDFGSYHGVIDLGFLDPALIYVRPIMLFVMVFGWYSFISKHLGRM